MPQMSQILRERAIGMMTAGMSTRVVARELNVHFSTIDRLQRHFREFGSTTNWPHKRRPRITTPAQDLHAKIVWDQPPGQLLQQSVYITKSFLHKLSNTISGKLICMLVVLIGVSTWLQFVIVTDLSGQTRFRLALWRGHRPQSTTWSTLCEGDVSHCVRQMVVTPDTDWFCVHGKSLRSLSSAHEKWGQKQKCYIYNFVQYKLVVGRYRR